jgi:cytochrome P450
MRRRPPWIATTPPPILKSKVALAQHPELASNSVDEVMRHAPIVFSHGPQAGEDVELGGVLIRAGTLIGANTSAANRDPTVYDNPDRFDITRENPAPMLTFGGGIR